MVDRSLTNDKELQDLIVEMEDQGWTVTKRANAHLLWTHESGAKVYSSTTPSDHWAIKNIRMDLERELKLEDPQWCNECITRFSHARREGDTLVLRCARGHEWKVEP